MRTARAIACLAVAGIAAQALPVTAVAATAPPATTSRYMKTTDTSVTYNEGCSAGRVLQQGLLVLDFGQPAVSGTTYGSIIFASNGFRSTKAVEEAAKSFLAGWWACTPADPSLTVAVGTTNYHGATNYNHGRAWGQMINNIALWLSQKRFSTQESVAGASDLELDWNTAAASRAWADGYTAASTRAYFNYGDAAGCPPYGSCDNGWTQDDVWYVSWGAPPAFAFPEIYTTNGSMASEWYRISLYGFSRYGGAIRISGSLTQHQACIDAGGCSGTDNTASAGWSQLYSKLNADTRTSQSLDYSSDITWRN
jgi:hypothetical protein